MTYVQFLLALCLWREARGEVLASKQAVASSIRNRTLRPSWWGNDIASVVTKRLQYSSMTAPGDPNLVQYPVENDTAWLACVEIAGDALDGTLPDTASGATSYFDKSLDAHPPAWATDGSMRHVCDVGNFHFYALV